MFFMLPFNVLGEISRTLALAIRLFANMLTGGFIAVVALALVGVFVPVLVQVFGAFTGLIQAYVFMLLTLVYIGSAIKPGDEGEDAGEETIDNPQEA